MKFHSEIQFKSTILNLFRFLYREGKKMIKNKVNNFDETRV